MVGLGHIYTIKFYPEYSRTVQANPLKALMSHTADSGAKPTKILRAQDYNPIEGQT
jgi:hypothetical protein